MRKLRAVAIAVATVVVIGCGPDAASSASSAASPVAGAAAAPAWGGFEVGEPVFGGAFDNPYGQVVSGVPFGDGFVLVGRSRDEGVRPHGAVWTSPDGATWARHADAAGTFDDMYLAHVATDGQRLVALGWHAPWLDGRRDAYVGWTSEDGGATWLRHDNLDSGELGAIYADGIVGSAAGAGFVAWGAPPDDGHTRLLWSADGVDWQRLDYRGSADDDITTVAAFRAGFVALGGRHWDGSIPPREPARAWFSAEGWTWRAADLPEGERTFRAAYPTSSGVYAVGQSHAGGVEPNLTWHSVDGRGWRSLGNEPGHSPFTASNGNQVARFAWQDDRSVSLSHDGIEWRAGADGIPVLEWDGGMLFGRNGILLIAALLPVESGVQHVHSGVLYLRGFSSPSTGQ